MWKQFATAAATLISLVVLSSGAEAQSTCPPTLNYGNVPTAAQWQNCFAQKQDYLGYTALNKAGDSMQGKLNAFASSAAQAGFRLIPGNAPTTPDNGDLWITSSGLFAQINGSSILLSSTPVSAGTGISVTNPGDGSAQISLVAPVTASNGGTGKTSFTLNAPLIGNGTGAIAEGARSGSTTTFATASGTLTNGHCVQIDASGNFVDSGAGCASAGGTVSSVAATVPSYMTVTGGPITTSGTLAISANLQSGNKFLASPLTGASGTPDMRAIGQKDVSSFVQGNGARILGVFSPEDYGAKGDRQFVNNDTITASGTSLTVSASRFASTDVGKTIFIGGAGPGGTVYRSTIASFVSATNVTLTDAVQTTVTSLVKPYEWFTDDTAAWQSMCTAIQTAGGGIIQVRPGAQYQWFSGTSSLDQSVACRIQNVIGVTANLAQATFTSKMTSQMTIGGTVTTGDVITVWFSSWVGAAGFPTSATATAAGGDTTATLATKLANSINANATLTAAGIGATTNGSIVNISPSFSQITWYVGLLGGNGITVSGAATETVRQSVPYGFDMFDANAVGIFGLTGTAISGYGDSTRGSSINWIACSNQGGSTDYGCRNSRFYVNSVNGGLNGVVITRVLCTGTWSYNNQIRGSFTNVGYPAPLNNDGRNTTIDIQTANIGRAFFTYNTSGVKARIVNTMTISRGLTQVNTSVNYSNCGDIANNTTSDIDVTWVDRDSTVFGTAQMELNLGFVGGSPGSVTANNITYHVDQVYTGNPATTLFNMGATPDDSAGDTVRNFTLDGSVQGSSSVPHPIHIMDAAGGFAGALSTGTFRVSLKAKDLTGTTSIGRAAKVVFDQANLSGQNFPSLDAGASADQITVSNGTTFANPTAQPIGQSLIVFPMGDGGQTGPNPGTTTFHCQGWTAGNNGGFCMVPYSMNARDLFVNFGTAPGAGETYTATVYKGGSPTSITCSTTGATVGTCNDQFNNTGHLANFNAGEEISVVIVSSGGAAVYHANSSIAFAKP